MEVFANAVKWIKDIVMAVIELCRVIKFKKGDSTEDAVLGIIDEVIDDAADAVS